MKDKAALPTSAEITRRLRIVTELRNLCLSLGRAKRMAKDQVSLTEQAERADRPESLRPQ